MSFTVLKKQKKIRSQNFNWIEKLWMKTFFLSVIYLNIQNWDSQKFSVVQKKNTLLLDLIIFHEEKVKKIRPPPKKKTKKKKKKKKKKFKKHWIRKDLLVIWFQVFLSNTNNFQTDTNTLDMSGPGSNGNEKVT